MVKWVAKSAYWTQVYSMKFADLFIFSYCDKDPIFPLRFELHMSQEIHAETQQAKESYLSFWEKCLGVK